MLQDAKLCNGVWLPAHEIHFQEVLEQITRTGKTGLYPSLASATPLVTDWRRCIDVGAHVGLWSRWLVRLFDKVEAFEPLKEHADLYEKNVPHGKWSMHRVALGSHPGKVALKTFDGDSGRAHINGPGDIEMRTLDSYAFTGVGLIKIDVEGYELQVVTGATRTILDNRPIVVLEQRGCDVDNFGAPRDLALAHLVELGMYPIQKVDSDWILGWV